MRRAHIVPLAVAVSLMAVGCGSDGGTGPGGGGSEYVFDFEDNTIAPFTNPWGSGVDIVSDPTGSGHGNVVRMSYSPPSGLSQERALQFTTPQIRYGETFWMRGDVYMPGAGNTSHNRKLIDYQGLKVRMTLHRRGTDLRYSIVDAMNGSEMETSAASTGITMSDDTWYTLEVMVRTNSANNVRDGVLEVYVNGESTPSFRKDTNLGWITDNAGQTYFDKFLTGFQLTIDSGDPAYQEYRYWDNIGYGADRIQ